MDLKDDEKSKKCCEHPHSSRYKTDPGQPFGKNLNPFYSIRGNTGDDVRKNLPNKRKNEEFINIFDDKLNRELKKEPSKGILDEMLKNYALNNNYNEYMYLKEQCDDYHGGKKRPHAPVASMSSNKLHTGYSFRSRDMFESPRCGFDLNFDDFTQENNRNEESPTNEMMRDYIIANGIETCEKSTFCRPLENMYNQEFVFRTLQKNAKLQRIVRKLVIERETGKQREAWNNYINDLKNKHRYYSNEPSRISPQYVPGDHNTQEMIDDCYNLRLNWRKPHPSQHLLEDINAAYDKMPSTMQGKYPHNYDSTLPPDVGLCFGDDDRFCYPSGSQASMLRLNKEQEGYAYNWRTRPSGRYYRGNSAVVDNNLASEIDGKQVAARPYFPVPLHTRKSRGSPGSIQTANLPLVNEEDYKELNVSKADIIPDNNNIFCPYYTETTPSAPEETYEQSPYVLVPLKRKCLKRHMHAAGVPYIQTVTKLDKHVKLPSKREYLMNNKDSSVPNNLVTFKHKIVDKPCDIPLKNDVCTDADLQKNECFSENFKIVTDNIMKLKANIRKSEENTKMNSLANIEEKIDCLMKSINSIKTDTQSKRNTILSKRSAAVSACEILTSSRAVLNRHSSDSSNYKNEEYMVQSSSRSFMISEVLPNELKRRRGSSMSKVETILLEEMKKSDQAKSDIAEILNLHNDRSCSLQITFDIPTKERSTEVTDSLSKTRYKWEKEPQYEERPLSDERSMTIAVNTDPLGLLALLRVSTETVKKIISYVPNLDYHFYLSLLPPLLPSRRCAPHYTCNICGASFSQPSQLSAHVKQHNLGRTRDCCVCRHSLDLKCARAALFTCRHCGQRFTRAYCCELHQKSCARQLGISHDVTSSHLLLQ